MLRKPITTRIENKILFLFDRSKDAKDIIHVIE